VGVAEFYEEETEKMDSKPETKDEGLEAEIAYVEGLSTIIWDRLLRLLQLCARSGKRSANEWEWF
jgi:hypothetical protein